jgi:acyl-CoA thioesterase FadM
MRFDYRLLIDEGPAGETELVLGHTVHGCVDRQGKVRPLPAWVGQVLAPHLPPADPVS